MLTFAWSQIWQNCGCKVRFVSWTVLKQTADGVRAGQRLYLTLNKCFWSYKALTERKVNFWAVLTTETAETWTPAFIQGCFPEASAAATAGHLDGEWMKLLCISLYLIILTDVRRQIPLKQGLVYTDMLWKTTLNRSDMFMTDFQFTNLKKKFKKKSKIFIISIYVYNKCMKINKHNSCRLCYLSIFTFHYYCHLMSVLYVHWLKPKMHYWPRKKRKKTRNSTLCPFLLASRFPELSTTSHCLPLRTELLPFLGHVRTTTLSPWQLNKLSAEEVRKKLVSGLWVMFI